MTEKEERKKDMEFIAKSLGEIKGKLNVIMSYTPNIPSYKIVEKSLWHLRENAPEVMRDVLLFGHLEDNKPIWTVCRFPSPEAYLKFIVDSINSGVEYEEWAYCDELYKAECGK